MTCLNMIKNARNPKDLYISEKIRERRRQLGLKQYKVAKDLGITSQQLSKYEKGVDRVPASRLQDIANILLVPITFFYKDLEGTSSSIKEIVKIVLEGKKIRFSGLDLEFILSSVENEDNL